MPTYHKICEVCDMPFKAWRSPDDNEPRFCSRACRKEGMIGQRTKKGKYVITPEMHKAIENVYKGDSGNGQVRDLAKRLKLPRWKLTRHAQGQGWIPITRRPTPPWTGKECETLQKFARYSPETIQRKMKEHGYHRTINAIVLKMRRKNMNQNLNGQSATSLAMCLGKDGHFVTNAIKRGDLRAKRRGTARVSRQGGDMYYIEDRDAREFIVNNVHAIDLRKVDKYWFVDLLAA